MSELKQENTKNNLKKKLDPEVLNMIIAAIISVLIGFYAGRYYERKLALKARRDIYNQMQKSVNGTSDTNRRPGGGNMMFIRPH